MRPEGRPGELFAAFSRITATAFADDRLLSCPTLSKAPNYGDVLRRFLTSAPHTPLRGKALVLAALRYTLTNVAHLFFLILTRMFIAMLGWKIPANLTGKELTPGTPQKDQRLNQKPHRPAQLLLFDSFAVLPRLAQKGEFDDLYLTGLYEEAESSGYACARLYRLYGSRNPLTLWKSIKILAAQGDGFTEAHFFTWTDWLLLCRHILLYPLALWRLVRKLTHYAPHLPEAYIRTALIHTMGQCVLIGEARRLAGFRLGHYLAAWPWTPDGAGLPKIISWYENQTLNKTFQRGLAQAKKRTGRHIPVTGAQLFPWPSNLLNNHPDDGEAALGLAPDHVVVNGPYFLPEESHQSYSIGPAVRYKDIFSAGRMHSAGEKKTSGTAENHLLALLSYHPEETRRVLELVLPLATEKGRVAYKFHPATQPSLYSTWLPPSPEIVTESLPIALQKASAVIGAGSGSLLEAVAMGIPAVGVEASGVSGLGLNYFPQKGPDCGKNELWATVQSSFEVDVALQRLSFNRNTDPQYVEKVEAFRNLVFTEPTRERLQNILGL